MESRNISLAPVTWQHFVRNRVPIVDCLLRSGAHRLMILEITHGTGERAGSMPFDEPSGRRDASFRHSK
jgi:hypothetical protein